MLPAMDIKLAKAGIEVSITTTDGMIGCDCKVRLVDGVMELKNGTAVVLRVLTKGLTFEFDEERMEVMFNHGDRRSLPDTVLTFTDYLAFLSFLRAM